MKGLESSPILFGLARQSGSGAQTAVVRGGRWGGWSQIHSTRRLHPAHPVLRPAEQGAVVLRCARHIVHHRGWSGDPHRNVDRLLPLALTLIRQYSSLNTKDLENSKVKYFPVVRAVSSIQSEDDIEKSMGMDNDVRVFKFSLRQEACQGQ